MKWTRYESQSSDRKMLIHINKSWDDIAAEPEKTFIKTRLAKYEFDVSVNHFNQTLKLFR